jgi:hypothetical protein
MGHRGERGLPTGLELFDPHLEALGAAQGCGGPELGPGRALQRVVEGAHERAFAHGADRSVVRGELAADQVTASQVAEGGQEDERRGCRAGDDRSP